MVILTQAFGLLTLPGWEGNYGIQLSRTIANYSSSGLYLKNLLRAAVR